MRVWIVTHRTTMNNGVVNTIPDKAFKRKKLAYAYAEGRNDGELLSEIYEMELIK